MGEGLYGGAYKTRHLPPQLDAKPPAAFPDIGKK